MFVSIQLKSAKFVFFLIVIMLLMLVEAMISYLFPITVAESLNSNFIMGIILSAGSAVGLVIDFTFPLIFKDKAWRNQLVLSIIVSLTFPVFSFLGAMWVSIWLFVVAAVVWGVFFEIASFAMQEFINTERKKATFTRDWGIIYFFWQISSIAGPLIATFFYGRSLIEVNFYMFMLLVIALLLACFGIKAPKKNYEHVVTDIKRKTNIFSEFKIYLLFSRKFLVIILVSIFLYSVECAYWTFGGLFAKENNSPSESLYLILYNIPLLVAYFILSRINLKNGKKRIAYILLVLGSLLLVPISFTSDTLVLSFIIFVSSLFLAFAGPIIKAVFSDLTDRTERYKENVEAIDNSTSNISYIFAPIILGFISDNFSLAATFGGIGVIGVILGIFLIVFSPRKLKVPHAQLEELKSA